MKILFITDNFPPESNAPASRTYEHIIEWQKKGAVVTVITCVPNFPKGEVFPGYKNKLIQTTEIDGIKVIRVWSFITPNRDLVKRILDYLSFSFMAFFAGLRVETDVIVATSPQLFSAFSGCFLSFFKRKPWVMEVRDLWPESIMAVDAMKENKMLKLLDKSVQWLYKKASHIIVVTNQFKESLESLSVDPDKISVVENGVHKYLYDPKKIEESIIEKLDLKDKFVVAYIGTHGMAHRLGFILDCAQEVQDPDIHFIFIGDGAMKTRLIKYAEELKLNNVTMLDAINKNEVANYISVSNAALIPLRKSETFTKVIPSKIFENAAMEKPILLGVEGEAAALINKYHAGICFEPENKASFLNAIDVLKKDKKKYLLMKEGCKRLAEDYDRSELAIRMLDKLNYVVKRKG